MQRCVVLYIAAARVFGRIILFRWISKPAPEFRLADFEMNIRIFCLSSTNSGKT